MLGPGRIEGRSAVSLILPDSAWIDLEAASEALHRAEAAVARGDYAEAWAPGRTAQHIAVRGFLPDEEGPWVREVRDGLETMYLRSLELVAETCLELRGGELDTAERAARSLVKQAPYRESEYRYLMDVLAHQGNDAEALRVYDDLRVLLREELGIPPSEPTQALYRRLLA